MAKTGTVEYVASLDRGLRLLQTFSREHAQLTLSEVAALTNLSPATARRSLHTLELLGYVGRSGRKFLLRPKVLALGAGYLSAINAEVVLQPFLQAMVTEVGGSSSVTVLDNLEIVYIAHASANRAIRLTAGAGSRYPAYPTSMGRVLLAHEPPAALDAYFERATFARLTASTETNPDELRRILERVRAAGYATVQDELDIGLVSVAVPITGPNGRVVAAANSSDVTNHVDQQALIEKRLPALRQTVRRIEQALVRHPELAHSVESIAATPITRAGARDQATELRRASDDRR
jgi:IclR family pca regulon transcriptional regulator